MIRNKERREEIVAYFNRYRDKGLTVESATVRTCDRYYLDSYELQDMLRASMYESVSGTRYP